MVTDAEAPTMIDVMTRAYGAPSERNTDYVTFARPRGSVAGNGVSRTAPCRQWSAISF
jgi:hypothetical protein